MGGGLCRLAQRGVTSGGLSAFCVTPGRGHTIRQSRKAPLIGSETYRQGRTSLVKAVDTVQEKSINGS